MGKKRAIEKGEQQEARKRRRGSAPPPKIAETIVNEDLYDTQLDEKRDRVASMFKDMQLPSIEVFKSEKKHYRQRAEFRVWQSAEDLFYVMFSKLDVETEDGKPRHEKLRVNDFPVASEMINKLMKGLLEHIKERHILRHKLFQANFLTTLSGEAVVTIVYHTDLLDTWMEPAKELRAVLKEKSGAKELHLVGRSKNQKIELDRDFVIEKLDVDGQSFIQKQVEGTFSQPNGHMCQNMLSWARSVTKSGSGDMLELYCGNGNFTVALADNFREIIATEQSKISVNAARYNLEANNISNVHVLRLSSEEFTQAWRGERKFFRMKDFPDITGRKFGTLLVDPPRSGLDDETLQLLQKFDNVVYISCNPETLLENLQKVQGTHSIARFALFDQFPYTKHIECGAYLVKNK